MLTIKEYNSLNNNQKMENIFLSFFPSRLSHLKHLYDVYNIVTAQLNPKQFTHAAHVFSFTM